jgi:hypothetical protein
MNRTSPVDKSSEMAVRCSSRNEETANVPDIDELGSVQSLADMTGVELEVAEYARQCAKQIEIEICHRRFSRISHITKKAERHLDEPQDELWAKPLGDVLGEQLATTMEMLGYEKWSDLVTFDAGAMLLKPQTGPQALSNLVRSMASAARPRY